MRKIKPHPVKVIQQLSFRNKLAFSISLLAFFFLFPGIYLSMLTVTNTGSVNANLPHLEKSFLGIPAVKGRQEEKMPLHIIDTSRSIVKTAWSLWERHYYFVALMIVLFSVIVPVTKGLLLFYIFFSRHPARREQIFQFIKAIGKWSMCDVFIVAVLLSYLSTGASQTQNVKDINMMGYNVHVNIMAGMHAELQMGFWFFLTYCLLSLLALQLYESY